MAWQIGIDFRATDGYVTDPSGYGPPGYVPETGYSVSGGDYTAARGYGWENSAPTWGSDTTTANNDARLTGSHYINDPALATYRIDLPAPGTYQVQLAIGAPGGNDSHVMRAEIHDGTSVLAVIVNDQTMPYAADGYFTGWDANGTAYNSNTPGGGWEAANPVGGGGSGARNLTFASTILRLVIGNAGGTSETSVAHLFVQSAGVTALALAAAAAGMGMARPAALFAAQAQMLGLALGVPRAGPSARAALAARGGALGAARGFIWNGVGLLALVARGGGMTFSGARTHLVAPLAARNTLTLTVTAPPQLPASLTATAHAGVFARAGAAFRGELQARAGAAGSAAAGGRFVTGLEARGGMAAAATGALGALGHFMATTRALAIGTTRAAMTILTPAPPSPMLINPTLEIISETDGPQKG